MNHGDVRRITRAITEQIARKEGSAGFDASDYRNICDVLFDWASREMGEDVMDGARVWNPGTN